MAPISRNGKICYIEMPATDVARSSEFYAKVSAPWHSTMESR